MKILLYFFQINQQQLPVWHFVMPKRKQGLSGDSTDYGISSASDSPDVSLHDTSYDESALPDPVRGDTVVLREEHTGFLVQVWPILTLPFPLRLCYKEIQ